MHNLINVEDMVVDMVNEIKVEVEAVDALNVEKKDIFHVIVLKEEPEVLVAPEEAQDVSSKIILNY